MQKAPTPAAGVGGRQVETDWQGGAYSCAWRPTDTRCVGREEHRQARWANGHAARNDQDGFGGFRGWSSQESAGNMPWPEPGELPVGLLLVPILQDVMIPEPFRG